MMDDFNAFSQPVASQSIQQKVDAFDFNFGEEDQKSEEEEPPSPTVPQATAPPAS